MSARKVVQIATAASEDSYDLIVALCDDGTMWEGAYSRADKTLKWAQMPDVPQDGLL